MIEVAAASGSRVTCPTLHVVASDSELAGSEAQLQESLRYFADARLAHVAEAWPHAASPPADRRSRAPL